jgi:hypothetical protein
MQYVYLVHHTHVISRNNEDVKLIGVFSSEEKAQEIVKKYENISGFKESKKGFNIDKYQIDAECWTEGFCTIEAEK